MVACPQRWHNVYGGVAAWQNMKQKAEQTAARRAHAAAARRIAFLSLLSFYIVLSPFLCGQAVCGVVAWDERHSCLRTPGIDMDGAALVLEQA